MIREKPKTVGGGFLSRAAKRKKGRFFSNLPIKGHQKSGLCANPPSCFLVPGEPGVPRNQSDGLY